MPLSQPKLIATVERLVGLLSAGGYQELERLTDRIRLRSEEIASAVSSYPGKVIATVSSEDLDVVEFRTSKEECWSVNVRLHTDTQSPSNLTMSLTSIQSASEYYTAELDDIHVL